ncbi:MAG: methylisocitrate lyase [Thermoplasmatales archaeon]|jgi:methylisocitrate lyase
MHPLGSNTNLGPSFLRNTINEGIVIAPGVFNAIGAMIAERQGFKAIYLSGSGIAGAMGLPDLSLTTLTEVVEEARRITRISKLPLIVDVDTGFGEVLNVERTVIEMEAANVSAIHIEDQVLPKKCGHLNGKELISKQEMVEKITAATSVRKNKDFMIIARTDARAVEGLEAAISRARAYIDAGADAIFPEALESAEEFKKFAEEVNAPLLANMTEFGKSPLLSAKDLEELGYKIVIFPLTAFRASLKTMEDIYGTIKREGTQRNIIEKLMTRKEFYDLIGYYSYETEDSEIKKKSSMKI